MLQLFDAVVAKDFMEKIVVSSAFPFDETGFWLPRPFSFKFENETSENRKKLKKIHFFTNQQYAEVLKGKQPVISFDSDDKAIQPSIWKRDITQRVKINYDADSEPFYLEKLYPKNKNGGLYFIFKSNCFDENTLNAALKLLGDNGIGLQRNLGNGQFEASKSKLEIDLPENSNAWVSLSLYRPENKTEIENILETSSYQFIKRGGWISSPEHEAHLSVRKQAIMMFTEGSVFSFKETGNASLVKGITEKVRPDWNEEKLHDIYRDGKAFFLPILESKK